MALEKISPGEAPACFAKVSASNGTDGGRQIRFRQACVHGTKCVATVIVLVLWCRSPGTMGKPEVPEAIGNGSGNLAGTGLMLTEESDTSGTVSGVESAPWHDAGRSPAERVQALLSRMSLEEKVAQLYAVWLGIDPDG